MDVFFSRLYKYRQSEKSNQKENFLTEILAFTLEKDETFRDQFGRAIQIEDKVEDIDVKPQLRAGKSGIPDIVLEINSDCIVVVEIKVGAEEGPSQLLRYAEYLFKSTRPKKHLVYLTKHGWEPDFDFTGLKFSHLRWHMIYRLLQSSDNILSIEFQKYLNEEGMSRKIDLRENQRSVILTYLEFFSSARDFLEELKDRIGKIGIVAILVEKMKAGEIGIVCNYKEIPVWVGFYQYQDNSEVMIEMPAFDNLEKGFKSLGWGSYFTDERKKDRKTFYLSNGYSIYLRNGKFEESLALNYLEKSFLELKTMIDHSVLT
jgi:hypothetical protein